MSWQRVARVAVCGLLPAMALGAGSVPVTVSPGSPAGSSVADPCPTFSWGAADGAEAYELVVYRLGEESKDIEVVLKERISGAALGWTPALDRCLERGQGYAWSVRATLGDGPSEWSPPNLFEIAAAVHESEVREAVTLVPRGPAERADSGTGEPSGLDVLGGESRAAAASALAPVDVGLPQLSVDGGVVATSFTGDGSTLTSLDPALMQTGTAAIDISGNAATANNSDTLDLFDSSAFATSAGLAGHLADANNPHSVSFGQLTPTTAKGDLLVEDGSGVSALPVGSDGQILTADSSTATGVAWASSAPRLAPAPVPRTGQTALFAFGDDGDLERGAVWPNPRFTDHGNGTVTDNLTGLIWLRDASCGDLAGTDTEGLGDWTTALTATAALATGTCGLTDGSVAGDWRLPNRFELASPLALGFWSPALPSASGTVKWSEGDAFSGVKSAHYWSSTTVASTTTNAWAVNVGPGDVTIDAKTEVNYVWPVRGGP